MVTARPAPRHPARSRALALLSAVSALISAACTTPTFPVSTPLAVASLRGCPLPAAALAASPAAQASPAPAASPNPVTTGTDVVAAPAGASVKFTAPVAKALVDGGPLYVKLALSNVTTVGAAAARRVEDLHLHVLLDQEHKPFTEEFKTVPVGHPKIIHTPGSEVCFASVPAGKHTLAVILTGANHVSVKPPVFEVIEFEVTGPESKGGGGGH
ncbi:MAG: hypothetical protein U0821_14560 [Chloroflexota bacterium]